MLEFIYNFFKYWLVEKEKEYYVDEETNETVYYIPDEDKLNISTFGLYNGSFANPETGFITYPATLIDITVTPNIEQFSNKYQRAWCEVSVYSALQLPTDVTDNSTLIQYYLDSLKFNDKVFKRLEGMNSNVVADFDMSNTKYFIHNVRRYSTELLDTEGLNKIGKTTFTFYISDFSAMSEYEYKRIIDSNFIFKLDEKFNI